MGKDKVKELITTHWSSKSTSFKKRASISAIAATIFLSGFIYFYTRDSYEFLMSTPDANVSAQVLEKLKEDGVKYDVKGDNIYVTGVNTDALKLEISGSGLMDSNATNAEWMSKPMFISEKQEATLLKKDMENSIKDAIGSYSEISDAKVILTIGKESSFKNDKVPSTAAIQVKLKSRLSARQILSIQQFVAASVPNLNKNDVVITDTDNNLLSRNNSEDMLSVEDTDIYSKNAEEKLVKDIENLIQGILPKTNFKVSAKIEMNFDKSKIEKETITTGPNNVISTEKHSEINTNTTTGGQAGTESNVPSYETPKKGNETLSENKSEIINYEPSKTVEQIVKSPEVKRCSVTVVADKELKPNEKEKLEEIISSAAIIDADRGDKFYVTGFATNNGESEDTNKGFLSTHFETILDKSIPITCLIVFVILILKILSMFKKEKIVEEESNLVIQEGIADEVTNTKDTRKEILEKELNENPQQIASVFKAWKDSEKR